MTGLESSGVDGRRDGRDAERGGDLHVGVVVDEIHGGRAGTLAMFAQDIIYGSREHAHDPPIDCLDAVVVALGC